MPNTSVNILTIDGIQYMYDITRGKYLSIPKAYLRAGTNRRTVTNEYLRLEGDQPSMTVGDSLIRDATIMSISANCETDHSWSVKIFKKGSDISIVTLDLVSASSKELTGLNVDVPRGSILLFKVEGLNIPFPRTMIELAWRV